MLLAGLAAGLYMAWNIGANDVANSMSTAVGAKAITYKQAIVIASILTVAGAVLVGGHVTATVKGGIFDPEAVDSTHLALGGLASVTAAAIWVTIATWKSLPISTSHSIIGGMLGFGLVAGGPEIISWITLGEVILSWITSPIFGAILAFIIFKIIVKLIFDSEDPERTAKKTTPFFLGAALFIITLSLLYETALSLKLFGRQPTMLEGLGMALVVGSVLGYAGKFIVLRYADGDNGIGEVENIFRNLQVLTSCFVAFSHGANDVANAIGPVMLVVENSVNKSLPFFMGTDYLLLMGGLGIAVGLSTWGYKVIKTVGFKVTKLTNTRGFSVDFGAATTILVASKLGMPISTSHTVVGAVFGVGMARGLEAVDLSVIKKIVISWLITVPIAGITCVFIYLGMAQFI
ncbi:MAG: inorganic phosphate transporter [Candidatus Thermoplasmatota archaeon]|nr:inorganic phosphate transporter [Candidatus Thermoplasmatota archaeon]